MKQLYAFGRDVDAKRYYRRAIPRQTDDGICYSIFAKSKHLFQVTYRYLTFSYSLPLRRAFFLD